MEIGESKEDYIEERGEVRHTTQCTVVNRYVIQL